VTLRLTGEPGISPHVERSFRLAKLERLIVAHNGDAA
jgi:hypothetical protein